MCMNVHARMHTHARIHTHTHTHTHTRLHTPASPRGPQRMTPRIRACTSPALVSADLYFPVTNMSSASTELTTE